MNIRRWDWDKQAFVEDTYPEEMFRPFLDWLFTTKNWREDPRRVNDRVLQLEKDMAAFRNPATRADVVAVDPALAAAIARDNLAATRRANLAKGRATLAAKRAAHKERAHAEV